MQRAGSFTALIALAGLVGAPLIVACIVNYCGGPAFPAAVITLVALSVGFMVWGLGDAVAEQLRQRRAFYLRLANPRYCAHSGPPPVCNLLAGMLLLVPAGMVTLFAVAVSADLPRDPELVWVLGGLVLVGLTVLWIALRFISDYLLERAAWREVLGYREAGDSKGPPAS